MRLLVVLLVVWQVGCETSGPAAVCSSGPSLGCAIRVNSGDECPAAADLCADNCGGPYDCCYCDDGQWAVIRIQCATCDAGLDAPTDASVDAAADASVDASM